jgi:hypothetical protein
MASTPVSSARIEVDAGRRDTQSNLWREETDGAAVRPAAEATNGDVDDLGQDIGTACYLCHGQCGNFGVQGREGRPCARGVNEIINRRRRARLIAQPDGRKGD